MTRAGDFIGSGWGFPATFSRAGAVRLVSGFEELDAAIRMIVSTRPGERVMRPDFGCAVWDHLFAPLDPRTLGQIERAVREAIGRWEPRIVLDRVGTVPDQATGTVLIEVDYRTRATNDLRNLVFPFYTIPTSESES